MSNEDRIKEINEALTANFVFTENELRNKLAESNAKTLEQIRPLLLQKLSEAEADGDTRGYARGFKEGVESTIPVPIPGFKCPKFSEWDSHIAFLKDLAVAGAQQDLANKYGPPAEDNSVYYCGWDNLRKVGMPALGLRVLKELYLPRYWSINAGNRMHWNFLEGINELAPDQRQFIFDAASRHGMRYDFGVENTVALARWQREISYIISAALLAQSLGYKIPVASATGPWDGADEGVAFERVTSALAACLSQWGGDTSFTHRYRNWDDREASKEYKIDWTKYRTIYKPFYFGILAAATRAAISAGLLDRAWALSRLVECVRIMMKAWQESAQGGFFWYEHTVEGKVFGSDTSNTAKLNGMIYPHVLWLAKELESQDLYDTSYKIFKGADIRMRNQKPTKKETEQLLRYTDVAFSQFN